MVIKAYHFTGIKLLTLPWLLVFEQVSCSFKIYAVREITKHPMLLN